MSTLNKIIFSALACVLMVFILMTSLVTNSLFKRSVDRAKEASISNSAHITESISSSLDDASKMLAMNEHTFSLIAANSKTKAESIEDALINILKINTDIHRTWVVFNKGIVDENEYFVREFANKDGLIGESYIMKDHDKSKLMETAAWYSEPLNTGESYFSISNPHHCGGSEGFVYTTIISMPIKSPDGEIVGICAVEVKYKDLFGQFLDLYEQQENTVLLLYKDMAILYAYDDELRNRNLEEFYTGGSENFRNTIERGDVFAEEAFDAFTNKNAFIYMGPIMPNELSDSNSLYIYISTSLSELYSDAYHIVTLMIIAGVICSVIIMGVILHRAHSIVRPIRALTQQARAITEGDFTSCIFDSSENDLPGKSEIADLRRALMKMLHMLNDNLRTVEKRVDERTRDLQKLNKYTKALMDCASSFSILLDGNEKILYHSDSLNTLMGEENDTEFIGRELQDIFMRVQNDNYDKRSAHRLSRILSGESILSERDAITWPDGTKRMYQIIYKRITDENDDLEGVVVVSHDITDTRMKEDERHLNDLLHSTALPCMIWDEEGRAVAYNKEAASIFRIPDNLSPEEFDSCVLSAQPEYQPDGKKTESIRRQVVREAVEKGISQVRIQLAEKDGTPIHFMVNITRIQYMFDYRLFVCYHDMTDYVLNQMKEKEAEKRIRLMLDAMPLCCTICDENYNIIDCNEETAKVLGFTDKQLYLNDFFRFSPEYQPDGQLSKVKAYNATREAFETGYAAFEWTHRDLEGEPIPADVILVRLKRYDVLTGDSDYVVAYVRDLREIKANEQKMKEITEKEREAQLQKEAAQAASEAKSQFLANMSHEIRTPMNAVLGMAELLFQEKLNTRQHRYVEDIRTSAMALINIINDVLDVSRLQAGKLELKPIHYDFGVMLDNIGSIVQFLIKGKDVVYKQVVHESANVCLFGDDVRFRQILLNLLGNAVKFTDEGHVRLEVDMTDTTIRLTVRDTGIGIPAESLPTLFDAFEQADTFKNRSTQGAGLGLTITKAIVEMMGGHISVESVYGRGSTFYVEIPKILGDESLIHYENYNDSVVFAPEAKVLVVDDNATNLNVASGLLQLYGIKAETAVSGKKAIEMIKQKTYDIVFMDQRMPEMDGIETTREIRRLGIPVKIIALTASTIGGQKERMLEAGMDDYLSKPIIRIELTQMIKKWLPDEMLLTPPSDNDEAGEEDDEKKKDFWKKVGQIEELSVLIGLGRVDGVRSVYERTLKLIVREIEKSNKNLVKFLSLRDMNSFRTEIHGLKTALANSGAMELSAKSSDLEKASAKNDIGFCEKNLPTLIKELNGFYRKLTDALQGITGGDDMSGIPPELPSILENMREAFSNTDLRLIEKELEKLKNLNLRGAVKDTIERISDAVMVMEYDVAEEFILKLLAA